MDPDSLARLQRNLKAATDDALVALANRGLVRRAAKDLDQKSTFRVEETQTALLVHGNGWIVTMPPEGPHAATDDTSATGVTRQILAATMYLRDHWLETLEPDTAQGESESPESVSPEIQAAAERLIEASIDELVKWSGKTPLLEAAATFAAQGEAQISYAPHLSIEFSQPGIRVVLMTDEPATTLKRLLDQFKTTGPKAEHSRWVLLAVLALKHSAGKSTTVENLEGATLTEAVREDRLRIARRTQLLLTAVAASGIAHPSTRIVERFRTASVAAEAARFPRLARLLNSIAVDAQLQIDRSAAADPARMRQRMVTAFALAEATARPEHAERIDLFGRPRTQYHPAGDLELAGIGAYGWRTASGFEGVTALFWDQKNARFLTASSTRGEGQDISFSLPLAYQSGLGWSGGTSIENLCRSQIVLTQAKTNMEGRLSLSEATRMTLGELTDPNTIDFGERIVRSWADLFPITQRSLPMGLRSPDPRASYLVLKPADWGERWFDELNQAFVWEVYDTSGDSLQIRVPWREVDEDAILFLEAIKLDREHPTAVLGRLEVASDQVYIYPFSIFSTGTQRGDKILCPQFDHDRIRSRNLHLLERLRKKFKRERVVETRMGEAEEEESPALSADSLLNLPPLIRNLLMDLDNILSAALEMGSNKLNPSAKEVLLDALDRLRSLGLRPLSQSLETLTQAEPFPAGDLLRAAYRLELFRQAANVSQLY